jgi:hypothetical protein
MAYLGPTITASTGTNGQNAPASSDVVGFANGLTTQQVSVNNQLPVVDPILIGAQSTDNPLKVSITGDESGDFAGINLLEQVMSDGTGLAFNTRILNPPKLDLLNAAIPSDAVQLPIVYLGVNVPQVIDTTGYQTVVFQQAAAVAVAVSQSNDGVNWVATLGVITNTSANFTTSTTAATVNAIYAFPVSARFMRFSAAAQTALNVYLRQTPFDSYLLNNGLAQVNISTIGGTANASQAGTLTLGTTASTNGMTLGTLVTPLTVSTTQIKASAGKLYHMSVGNAQTTAVYLKIYNQTSVTLGTTAATLNYLIPGGTTGGTFNLDISDVGLYFSTGIIIAVTGGQALTDSTALTTAAVVNYSYI